MASDVLAGAAFLVGVTFLAAGVAFLAAGSAAFTAFVAGAAFLVVAVVVFFAVVPLAAAARVLPASTCTEMPRPLRWARRPFRWRGSTAAASLACRTCSGLSEPVTDPVSTSATTAGWASTGAGILRAFEDTNTSRQNGASKGPRSIGARQDPVSSRAASPFCHAGREDSASASTHGIGHPEAAFAAAFFAFLKSRTFCSEAGSTTSATER